MITRFAGPLLRLDAVCAYVGAGTAEGPKLAEMFGAARYEGPFSRLDQLFWRESVDAALEDLPGWETNPADDIGASRRAAIEDGARPPPYAQHECDRDRL